MLDATLFPPPVIVSGDRGPRCRRCRARPPPRQVGARDRHGVCDRRKDGPSAPSGAAISSAHVAINAIRARVGPWGDSRSGSPAKWSLMGASAWAGAPRSRRVPRPRGPRPSSPAAEREVHDRALVVGIDDAADEHRLEVLGSPNCGIVGGVSIRSRPSASVRTDALCPGLDAQALAQRLGLGRVLDVVARLRRGPLRLPVERAARAACNRSRCNTWSRPQPGSRARRRR